MRAYGFLLLAVFSQTSWALDVSAWSDKTLCRVANDQPKNEDFKSAIDARGLSCIVAVSKAKSQGVIDGLCKAPYKSAPSIDLDYNAEFSLNRYFTNGDSFQLNEYRYTGFGTDPIGHLKGGGIGAEVKVVADLNNDGRDDLWLDYYESEVPSLILYGTADGGFIEEKNMQGNVSRRHIRNGDVADFNNDGWLDLVGFTTGDPGVRMEAQGYDLGGRFIPRGQKDILLMNMEGKGFAAMNIPEVRKNDWNHGGSAGDINGDGWVEILPLSEGEKEHTVPLVNHSGIKHTLNQYPYSTEISRYLTSDMDAGDLDGDGIDDMVFNMMPILSASNSALKKLGSVRVIYGDSDMNFKDNRQLKFGESWVTDSDMAELSENYTHEESQIKGWVFKTELGPSNIEIIDINADNRPDILQGIWIAGTGLQQTSGFKAYINMGDCFADGTAYHFPAQQTNRALHRDMDYHTNYIQNFRAGDVNNDGLNDIVLQIDGTSYWQRSGETRFPYLFINNGNNIYLPPTIAAMTGIIERHDDMVPGDFNGDGLTDLVSIEREDGHMGTSKVRLHLQKANPDSSTAVYTPSDFLNISGGSKKRIAKLMVNTMKMEVSLEDFLNNVTNFDEKTSKSELYGSYRLDWFIINIGPSGGYDKGATDYVTINGDGMIFYKVDRAKFPTPDLRKKLEFTMSGDGNFTLKGPLGLFYLEGRSFPTTIFGNIHQKLGLGIWQEGDPILVRLTKQ
tara:strand:+ start:438 stop:2633 length:2196 start_codon:yes stop_codon:yes gene_type:complete